MLARNISLWLLVLIIAGSAALAQSKPAYRLYSRNGKKVSYPQMIKAVRGADVVFFGEIHNNPVSHWLSLQILQDLAAEHNDLVLGMEMFETDDQVILDEYQQGLIQEQHLLNEAKVWDNYDTDYQPLVNFALNHQIPVLATNLPRRYASLVFRQGLSALDSLSEVARPWMVPLPMEVNQKLATYQSMVQSMGEHGGAGATQFVEAQAIKDATMAHFIGQQLPAHVLHINGAFHSQQDEGIVWYLQQAHPDLNIVTIHSVEQPSVDSLLQAHEGLADYILTIPADMIKTH